MISTRYENRRLRLMAEAATGDDVLDIGYARMPNPYLREGTVVGLDLLAPPDEMPACYRECVIGDANDIASALPDRTFDTVLASELIEHLERPYDFLRSMRQCIKPDGRLILSTPNPVGQPLLWFELAQSQTRYYTREHVYYFAPRWVRRMLEHAGYTLEAVRGVGFGHPLFVVPAPVALSYQVIYIARVSE